MNSLVKYGGGLVATLIGSNILVDGPLELATFVAFIGAGIYAAGRFGGVRNRLTDHANSAMIKVNEATWP